MRKAQKRQAENCIELLEEAHDEVRKFVEAGDQEAALELLRQCQESAFELGCFLEETAGEGAPMIPLLEDYCETVYRKYEKLARDWQGNQKDGDKINKELQQSLVRVKDSLKKEIKIRYEIAFMPYKASMWDSLESVWQAAAEDKDCDVYVIPIPYYDRKADRSFGQFHYEGGDFPDYIEITDYRTYDLAQRRPDVIYIHNPYDDHNYVTSVAPQFYSSELKKYTECLVYIPYCVYEEFDSPEREETMEFCSRYITPGLLLADQVIVQSENFRRAVINALLKYCGKDRAFWEKKIVPLGSPKYDKVRSAGAGHQEMPENWKRLIFKSDGSRKKVIFYNTSLNSLLLYGEKMNRKIRSVLRFFYEKREECTLLWRPHPLIKATIESMRPLLWAEYREIVDVYMAEGWGIYDDSPDFHAAFDVSDAYYGDYSSLLLLYQASGKPALMQNVDILDYKKRLVTNRLYYDGEYVWGAAWEFNGLFRIDPGTWKAVYMGQFPGEEPEGYGLFYGIAECNGKLYFCPHNAKHIAVYDKQSGQFDMIGLKESIRDTARKFVGILTDGTCIYMQGGYINAIVRLNVETNEVLYIDHWVNRMHELRKKATGSLFAKDGCIYEGNLYYTCLETEHLLSITLHSLNYEFIPIQHNSGAGFRVFNTDGLFWFMPMKRGSITCFDSGTSVLKEVLQISGVTDFCRIHSYVYFFSLEEQYFYRVDINSKEVTEFPVKGGIECVCPMGDKIIMTVYLSGRQYVFDTISLEMTNIDVFADADEIPGQNGSKILENSKIYNQYARESGYINSEILLNAGMEKSEIQLDKKCDCHGEKIYQYVKGLLE